MATLDTNLKQNDLFIVDRDGVTYKMKGKELRDPINEAQDTANNALDKANSNAGDIGQLEDSLAEIKTVPVGTILWYAGVSVPVGYLYCDGKLINKNQYAALSDAIGNVYGESGDRFRVPDLRDRFIMGYDNRDTRHYGSKQGARNTAHTHSIDANTGNQSTSHTHVASGVVNSNTQTHTHTGTTDVFDGNATTNTDPTEGPNATYTSVWSGRSSQPMQGVGDQRRKYNTSGLNGVYDEAGNPINNNHSHKVTIQNNGAHDHNYRYVNDMIEFFAFPPNSESDSGTGGGSFTVISRNGTEKKTERYGTVWKGITLRDTNQKGVHSHTVTVSDQDNGHKHEMNHWHEAEHKHTYPHTHANNHTHEIKHKHNFSTGGATNSNGGSHNHTYSANTGSNSSNHKHEFTANTDSQGATAGAPKNINIMPIIRAY